MRLTGLERWMLVVAVISVDSYPFLTFSDQTCHLENTRIAVFWLHCPSDSKETKLGSCDQGVSCSAIKNTGVVLLSLCAWKCVPIANFWWCGYFWGPWVSFVMTDEFSGSQKVTSRIVVSWTHTLHLYFWFLFFNSMDYNHVIRSM